jgi:hypothetical protein
MLAVPSVNSLWLIDGENGAGDLGWGEIHGQLSWIRYRYSRGIMPFKSKAQRRKFAQLLVEGKISNEVYEEWNRETGGQKLPERVVHRAAGKKKAVKRRTTKKSRK